MGTDIEVGVDTTAQAIEAWQTKLDNLNLVVGVLKQWREQYQATLVGNLGGVGFTKEQADGKAIAILEKLAPPEGRRDEGGVNSYTYWVYTGRNTAGGVRAEVRYAMLRTQDDINHVTVSPNQHGGWLEAMGNEIAQAQRKATFFAKVIEKSAILQGQDDTIRNLRAESFAFLKEYDGVDLDDVECELGATWPNLFTVWNQKYNDGCDDDDD